MQKVVLRKVVDVDVDPNLLLCQIFSLNLSQRIDHHYLVSASPLSILALNIQTMCLTYILYIWACFQRWFITNQVIFIRQCFTNVS